MSLSRLSRRTHLFSYRYKPLHHASPLPSRSHEAFGQRCKSFGVDSSIYGQRLGLEFRGFMSRCEYNKLTFNKHSGFSPLRNNDFKREIVMQFNGDVADRMSWKFIPTQGEVRVKPCLYIAENRSSEPIKGVSTYNVTPMKAAVYFNKIQCFCFEEQRLLPGEQIDMLVFF